CTSFVSSFTLSKTAKILSPRRYPTKANRPTGIAGRRAPSPRPSPAERERRSAKSFVLTLTFWGPVRPKPCMALGRKALWVILSLTALPEAAAAAAPNEIPEIRISRASAPIVIDGDLSDEGWKGATKIEKFFETNPGDNVEPKVRTVAYLAYDDHFFYAGFEFFDPDPSKIRAPYADRDDVSSSTDYGGIILDTRNDRRTGLLLLANPRGIQYDAISDDTTGNEDSSPDYYWDSAAKITAQGWVLEIRVPLSSLRYPPGDKQ